jgi:hypothetical protein
MGNVANRYGSVSGSVRHIIVIEGHRVIRRLIMLVSSLPPLIGDFLFMESSSSLEEEYVVPLLVFALSFLFSALSFSSFFMRSSKVGVLEVPDF